MKKRGKTIVLILSAICLSVFIGLFVTGLSIGWGPFSFLYWPKEVRRAKKENPYNDYQDGVVFYGASNFRLWKEMKDDLSGYPVANCGFGGSTDKLLMKYADELLYPYNPKVIFLQTGSNDYPGETGSPEEVAERILSTKLAMYEEFHENLPKAHIYVMAGILMPGRSEYTEIVKLVNQELRELSEGTDYLTFIDSESLTYQGGQYVEEYFIKDGIHLTHEARLIWAKEYIIPALNQHY